MNDAARRLILVCDGDLSCFPVEGDPPDGEYGYNWVVVRAIDDNDAREIAKPVLQDGRLIECNFRILTEGRARRAFREE